MSLLFLCSEKLTIPGKYFEKTVFRHLKTNNLCCNHFIAYIFSIDN